MHDKTDTVKATVKFLDDTNGGTVRARIPATEIARWKEHPDEIPSNVVYPHDLPLLRERHRRGGR